MSWNVVGNVNSEQDLADYALRALGGGMINIEITPEQIQDRINQALEFFLVRYYNMMTENWLVYRMTDADVANGYFQVPPGWISVHQLYDPMGESGQSTVDDFDNLNYRLANSDFFNFSWTVSSDMVTSYHLFQEKINLIKLYFTPEIRYRFNATQGRITLERGGLFTGYMFILNGYVALDPTVTPAIYNDPWLKRYAIALLGMQWGSNISKYTGIQLPGGVTMDGDKMYTRYDDMKTKLEEEFMSSMESPMMFTVE